MNNKKKCFVIMPISKTKSCTKDEWAGIFEHMIKPTIRGSKLGFDCEQAKPRTGSFIRDILEGLNRADVVIADLTDKNPNVCYELGIRHTLKNRTILIAQDIKHVPSDLRSYWVVTYKKDLTGANEFKKKIREILREMQKDPDKPDSPVADFLQLKNIDINDYEKSEKIKRLSALISEISYNVDTIDLFIKRVKENIKAREEGKTKDISWLHQRLSNTCIELIISTLYIILPQEVLKKIRMHNHMVKLLNSNLEQWSDDKYSESIEKKLLDSLSTIKDWVTELLKIVGKIRIDYINDNYIEPKEPVIILSRPEHEEYLKPLE